jgi:hypothetical protein
LLVTGHRRAKQFHTGGARWLGVSNAGAIVLAEKTKGLNLLKNVSIAGATTTLGPVPWFAVTVKELLAGAPVWLETPSIRNEDEKFLEIFWP